MTELPPEAITRAMTGARWAALVRTDIDVPGLRTWDPTLLRQSRVLVPVDVQALYVPAGDTEPYVRLPFVLTAPDGQPPEPMPAPFDPGAPRAPGVYLHWALPDALLRGTLEDRRDQPNRLDLPPLPDRWVVLRLIAPRDSVTPQVSGWVLESDSARVVALEAWDGQPATGVPQLGRTLTPDELDGTAGGSVTWTAGYDATVGRFAVHDPLAGLPAGGAVQDLATYLVAGWWSDPARDPLDGAQTDSSLHVRLTGLGWSLTTDAEGGDGVDRARSVLAARREAFLATADRYTVRDVRSTVRPDRGPARPDGAGSRANDPLGLSAVPKPLPVNDRLRALAEPVQLFKPAFSALADVAASVVASEPRWPRSTLLHGTVHGVPVIGPVVADGRPGDSALEVALGHHGDDVAATLTALGLGADTPDERRSLERVLSAFTGHLLTSLGSADGLVDVDEHEHTSGFSALPGGDGGVERVTLGATAGPFDAGRAARGAQARNPKSAGKAFDPVGLDSVIEWTGQDRTSLYSPSALRSRVHAWQGPDPARPERTEVREVRRPAPRLYRPLDPLVAVKGPRRSLRHGWDGRFSPDGRLLCRWPSQIPQGYAQLVDGARLLPSVGSGALPPEVVALAREALTQSPYLWRWLAEVARSQRGIDAATAATRIGAEVMLRYGPNAVYDGATAAFTATLAGVHGAGERAAVPAVTGRLVADELRRFSLVQGVDAAPVAVTTWTQPWIPMWLEWAAEVALGDRFDDWTLGAVDLDPPADPAPAPPTRTLTGRSPLHAGTATTLAKSIEAWARAEDALDARNQGEADEATEFLLSGLADAAEHLDIVTASLDGLHDRLVGLPADDGVLRPRGADGSLGRVAPVADPQLAVAGSVRLTAARLVDAFGRTLDVPVDRLRVPARDEITPVREGTAPALRVRPRLTRPARWLFRFVDPAAAPDPATEPAEASIDQADPLAMVNPVAGFLLPDHIDEALEAFDVNGRPLGQLMEGGVGGGVQWEIAPGREGPADAGPLYGLDGSARLLGHLAAGMVAADAAARGGFPVGETQPESGLSAFLRAVDSTLWTVDTFASLGSEHIAGLVGRPLAVVRATLRLEIDDDLDELDLPDPARRAAREQAYRDLADRAFAVRIGELTRSDDGLLAFFVDDDYEHAHVVDKVVRDGALASGRWQGHFGRFGQTPVVPGEQAITHPYVVADDELRVHPGQVVRLTLLMHPAGKVHLTSGVLPRKSLQLARDWVRPGLSVLAPSARIGPVLIDTKQVRLPKISAFGKDQVWTRRDTPSTWRNDPILAATQTALLPDLPHQVEEGYIRIAPALPAPPPTPGPPTSPTGASS
jgi:hypothetical protein